MIEYIIFKKNRKSNSVQLSFLSIFIGPAIQPILK